jgi:hypothetical protein
MVGPVQAQSPTQGDYYAPGPTTVVHPTEGQLKLNEQGDYYVGGQDDPQQTPRGGTQTAIFQTRC